MFSIAYSLCAQLILTLPLYGAKMAQPTGRSMFSTIRWVNMQSRLGLQVNCCIQSRKLQKRQKEGSSVPQVLQDFCHTSVGNITLPLMCFEENHYNLGKEILNSNTLSLTESQINKTELYKRTELFAYLLKKKPYFHNKFTSRD